MIITDRRSALTTKNHRRSRSADDSFLLPKQVGFVDDSDTGIRDVSDRLLSSDLSGMLFIIYVVIIYSKTCRKRPLKNRQNKGVKDI